MQDEDTFVIKTFIGIHNSNREPTNRQAIAEWLAMEYMRVFKRNPNYLVKDMVDEVKEKYAIQVNPMTDYRAKWKALNKIRGSFEEHYAKLRSYVAVLKTLCHTCILNT